MKLSGTLLALVVLASATLVACDFNSNVDADQTPIDFVGTLRALNDTIVVDADGDGAFDDTVTVPVSGTVSGTYDPFGGTFSINVNANGLVDGTHAQHIHILSACPSLAAADADGILDVIEGFPVYGGVLVQLDSDIANLTGGDFPSAAGGAYAYSASTSYNTLRDALIRRDPDGTVRLDSVGMRLAAFGTVDTLSVGSELSPLGRVVVVHGVNPNWVLPNTVGTLGRPDGTAIPATASIPVACAELRVAGTPDPTEPRTN